MKKPNILIDMHDLIIISLPITYPEAVANEWQMMKWVQLNQKEIPSGNVYEFAILNKDETKCVPLRYLGKKDKIYNVGEVTKKNCFNEYVFNKLNLEKRAKQIGNSDKFLITNDRIGEFVVSKNQIDFGISYKKIYNINDTLIREQISQYLRKLSEKINNEENKEILENYKKEYRNF